MPAQPPTDIGHAALLPIVARLETASTLAEAVEAVGRLETALSGHFQAEESTGGLFEQIREAAPHKDLAVRRLEQEHVDLLETSRSLALRLKALSSDLHGFARRLRHHEQEENDLHHHALYTDLGGGD